MNLGNPEEFTILELAEIVIGLTGSRSKIVSRRCRSTTRSVVSQIFRSREENSTGNLEQN